MKPVGKATGKLVRGTWRFKRGGGAISSITGREFAEGAGYAYGGQFLAHSPKLVRGAAAGIGVGYAYDYFSGSGASSAQSYQQHGGASGIPTYSSIHDLVAAVPKGSRLQKPKWVAEKGWNPGDKRGRHVCKKGWQLIRVGRAFMCMERPR